MSGKIIIAITNPKNYGYSACALAFANKIKEKFLANSEILQINFEQINTISDILKNGKIKDVNFVASGGYGLLAFNSIISNINKQKINTKFYYVCDRYIALKKDDISNLDTKNLFIIVPNFSFNYFKELFKNHKIKPILLEANLMEVNQNLIKQNALNFKAANLDICQEIKTIKKFSLWAEELKSLLINT